MSARAGIVVTGTEVLTGRWRTATGRGCPTACASSASTMRLTVVVGDRPEDMQRALRFLASRAST